MNESDKVYVDTRALNRWDNLPEHVKTDILRTLEPLANVPPEQWPARIRPWRPKENLYVLPAWVDTEELFVFVYPNGNQVHIENLLYRSLLEQIRGKPVTELA